jgi:hypothetical protein
MTASEFQQAWKTDAASAIQAFIVGLSKMDESGIIAIATLQDMGITEVRLRDTLLRATNANELFGKALGMANDEWKRNTALTKEAYTRYATTQSRITRYIFNGQNGIPSLCSQMAALGRDFNADIPTEPVICGNVNTVNYLDLCPQQEFFPQFYPMHNHDDYKVTNTNTLADPAFSEYPGGQLTFIQADAPLHDSNCCHD